MKNIPGTDAVEFKGASHDNGGIMLDDQTEVEGGETMDQVTMKKGGKRSLHNATTHDDAQAWIDGDNTKVKKDQLVIEHRPGIYRKCENYCFASSVCDQYNNT